MAPITISGYLANNTTPFAYELKPSSVQLMIKNIGDDVKALDGTNHRFHRNYKREFKLTFTNVRDTVADEIQTVFTIPNEFIFKYIDGTSYTVYTEPDSFTKDLAATNVSLQGIAVYEVSIGLCEV
jgi:hypothetical protein